MCKLFSCRNIKNEYSVFLIFPLTYLNDAMRAVMIQGQSLGDVWLDIVVLLGFTLIFFVVGVLRFNRDV